VPSLKAIRKRINSVKSTQKITRAMKMVAGARLNRAQLRITELRPYAVKVQHVLADITAKPKGDAALEIPAGMESGEKPAHPLLAEREEKRVLIVVLSSDRGLCGAFNTNISKRAEREWRTRTEQGQSVKMMLIGRKGRDYFTRRNAPIEKYIPGVWEELNYAKAKIVGNEILAPFNRNEVDAIYAVYNEFKSAMSQDVVVERLLPVDEPKESFLGEDQGQEFLYEPDKVALLEQLVPMYIDISILRALYESMASELGARMTAMDSATKNASEMIDRLTLQYNKARQAAITKELMEIIGGSEALKD
jgi:F-type H+-transporting ATPase subunit gamma